MVAQFPFQVAVFNFKPFYTKFSPAFRLKMDLSRVNYADNKTLSDAHIPEALKSLVGNDLLEAPTKSLAA